MPPSVAANLVESEPESPNLCPCVCMCETLYIWLNSITRRYKDN